MEAGRLRPSPPRFRRASTRSPGPRGQGQSWYRAVTIDHGAAEPLWRQLADILRGKIESGELPAGRVMPSENTLSQEYG